jgi:hypothetical protein
VRRRGLLFGVVLLVLAIGVAALVLRDDLGPGLRALHAAPMRIRDAGPVRLELELSLVYPDRSGKTVTSTAEIDDERDRAHVELADVIGPGDLELVAQGEVLNLSVPAALQEELGVRWLRVAVDSAAAARGAGVGPLPDPLTILHALEGARGRVETTDADRDLTLYRFEVSVRELADRGGDDRVAWAEVLYPLGPTLAGEAYLDDEGRPRRIRLTSDLGERGTIVALLDVETITEGITIGLPPTDATLGVETIAEALRMVTR